ncbi:MAG: hypothetical protein ACLQVN_06570 [Bryobacteraceae bacterium]
MPHREKSKFVSRSQLLLQYLLATGMITDSDGPDVAAIPFDTHPPLSIPRVASAGLPEDGFAG